MSTGYSGGGRDDAKKGTTGTDDVLIPVLCVLVPIFLPVMLLLSFFGEKERGRQMRRLVFGGFVIWSMIVLALAFARH